MNNVRNLSISLEVAKDWYKQGGDLKSIALQVFKEYELQYQPKSWEEFCQLTNTPDIQGVGVPPEIIALMKLTKLRDYYCRGFEFVLGDCYYYIVNAIRADDDGSYYENIEYWETEYYHNETLMFPTASLVNEFINNFKDLLLSAKRYL